MEELLPRSGKEYAEEIFRIVEVKKNKKVRVEKVGNQKQKDKEKEINEENEEYGENEEDDEENEFNVNEDEENEGSWENE